MASHEFEVLILGDLREPTWVTIEGDLVGPSNTFAVHKSLFWDDQEKEFRYGPSQYMITHVPTGRHIHYYVSTRGRAMAIAEKLEELGYGRFDSEDPHEAARGLEEAGIRTHRSELQQRSHGRNTKRAIEKIRAYYPDSDTPAQTRKRRSSAKKRPKSRKRRRRLESDFDLLDAAKAARG
jgi:hypothetical protein